MIIVTKTNTGAQALRRRICGTIFVRYCPKYISDVFIIQLFDIFALFCYHRNMKTPGYDP